jgi:hypothetical protein
MPSSTSSVLFCSFKLLHCGISPYISSFPYSSLLFSVHITVM